MRLLWQINKNVLMRCKHWLFVGVIILSLVPSSIFALPYGHELIAPSAWLGGAGVSVYSNGDNWASGHWQCVELAQRLYHQRGWHPQPRFHHVGSARQIFDLSHPLGMERQQNGSITSIRPGDMIIHDGSVGQGHGHVAVVDYVHGLQVHAVEQNYSKNGRATYSFLGGVLHRSDLGGIRGIVYKQSARHLQSSSRVSSAIVHKGVELSVFKRVGDKIYKNSWHGSRWSGFGALEGSIASDPVAVSHKDEISVFARGHNGQVYKNTWDGKRWSGFGSLGGDTVGRPEAISYKGELTVFARGKHGDILKNTWNGTKWSGFGSLGGNVASDPSAVVYGNELSVFARGKDGQVYKNSWHGVRWSGFGSLGGNTKGRPHAISYKGELSVFARGVDNKIHKNSWHGKKWSGFGVMQGEGLTGDPVAVQYGDELSVFAQGGNGQIYKSSWHGTKWSGFGSLGGNVVGRPEPIAYKNELTVFALNGEGETMKNSWHGSRWSGFGVLK